MVCCCCCVCQYAIASFLARNKVNSVRLPLCVKCVADNPKPNGNVVNQWANRAINVTSYLESRKSSGTVRSRCCSASTR